MATYSHEIKSEEIYRWSVPSYPMGACWSEVDRAIEEALRKYRLVFGVDNVPDDAIRCFPDDESIRIEFRVKEK